MPLEEYRRKRKFQQTPEPTGGEAAPIGARFVVQMHHATRLHYDFRLEVDGVLKSWAVPRGPTLDPTQKRLAMMVEDHPLDYMTFEGIIPAGNYGAGTVMVWDIGTFEPVLGVYKNQAGDINAMLKSGDLKFILHGQKLQGEFALVHMKSRRPSSKGNEWLMFKKKDAHADTAWTVEQADRSALTGRTMMEIAADRGSAMWGKEKVPQAARKAAERTIAREGVSLNASLQGLAGTRQAPLPSKIEPMLAKTAVQAPQGADWLAEIKWDGIRAIVTVDEGTLKLVSRNQRDITKHYPDLAGIVAQIRARRAVLDGEIVCLEPSGRPSFEVLQQRMNLRTPDPRKVAEYPVTFYAFDLLYLQPEGSEVGYDLREVALEKRKELLRALLRPPEKQEDRARFSDHHAGDAAMLFQLAQQQGLEGILAKRRLSTYQERRTDDWLKIKTEMRQECVVCGWKESDGAGRLIKSLSLGVYEGKKMVFAGTAGSGFNERSERDVLTQLQELPKAKMPFKEVPEGEEKTIWVKPMLVAEIKFLEWTMEGRMRAPVFLGLRPDKDPKDCVVESAVTVSASVSGVDQPTRVPEPAPAPLFAKRSGEETVTVDGQLMRVQKLDKLFFPRDGYAKVDVIEYYFRIAPYLLPHMKDKPVVMKRYPDGIEKPFFFQKDAGAAMPSWVRTVAIPTGEGTGEAGGGVTRFVMCDNRATLVYLAQLGCIDHNLWQGRVKTIDSPDFILFDLDPGDRATMATLVETAQCLHAVFEKLGLTSYPKTSGAAGMHIYVPLEPIYSYEQARRLCEVICRFVESQQPKLMTHERSLGRRPQERIYLDYMQIGQGKTVPPPYSMRPQPGATISTPLDWSEVRPGLDPRAFTLQTIWSRLAEKGDLFAGTLQRPQRLDTAVERLESLASG
jgi:bifunctional non-homologous end joining protein LigD